MLTPEQVSKRQFSDSAWFVKIVIGGTLMIIPVINFFALGYFYRLVKAGFRGEAPSMPDWVDVGDLFVDGLRFFVPTFVFGLVPMFLAWLVHIFLSPVLGPLSYVPQIPVFLLALPLTAASVYCYLNREDWRDAFQVGVLFKMLDAVKMKLAVPTLAFIGLVVAAFPLLPYAFFAGGVVLFFYYAHLFRTLENELKNA